MMNFLKEWKLILVILTLGSMFGLFFILLTSQTAHSPSVIIEVPVDPEPPVVNPEVKVMSKYIKLRNSRIPTEVAMMIAEAIIEISDKNGISPYLLNGIAEKESMYDCYAVSSANAKGVMQVLIEDGIDIDDKQVFNIRYNVQKSAEILNSKLKKSNGDIRVALEKYSGGQKGYVPAVYENIGRYVIYKDKSLIDTDNVTQN